MSHIHWHRGQLPPLGRSSRRGVRRRSGRSAPSAAPHPSPRRLSSRTRPSPENRKPPSLREPPVRKSSCLLTPRGGAGRDTRSRGRGSLQLSRRPAPRQSRTRKGGRPPALHGMASRGLVRPVRLPISPASKSPVAPEPQHRALRVSPKRRWVRWDPGPPHWVATPVGTGGASRWPHD